MKPSKKALLEQLTETQKLAEEMNTTNCELSDYLQITMEFIKEKGLKEEFGAFYDSKTSKAVK